jgi:hypothetical protein
MLHLTTKYAKAGNKDRREDLISGAQAALPAGLHCQNLSRWRRSER